MKKKFFHNNKAISKIAPIKIYSQTSNLNPKLNVDINTLLNRVKNEVYQEKKSKIIFFSSITFLIGLIGFFISIIK